MNAVEVVLQRADLQAYARTTGMHQLQVARRAAIAVLIGLIFGLLAFLIEPRVTTLLVMTVAVAIPSYIWLAPALMGRSARMIVRRAGLMMPQYPLQYRVAIDENGVHVAGRNGTTSRPWSSVRNIEVHDKMLVIHTIGPTIIPRHCFRSDADGAAFIQLASQLWVAGRDRREQGGS